MESKNEHLIVDRIEEEYVVCENENREVVTIPLAELKFSVVEGDILMRKDNIYHLDQEEKQKRQKRNIELQDSLFE